MITVPIVRVLDPDEPGSVTVYVDGLVAGEATRFGLDTGAGTSAVPNGPHIHHLAVVGTDLGFGSSGTAMNDDVVVVPSLSIGDAVVHDVPVSRFDPAAQRRPLLGMDVLGRYRCALRFSTWRLELDGQAPAGADLLPLSRFERGHIVADVQFGAETAFALIDTGASLTAVDATFAEAHPHLIEVGAAASGFDAAGADVPSVSGRLAACTIGILEFAPSECVIVDLGPINATIERPLDVIVGMPLLAQADWWFDTPAGRWTVHRLTG